MHSEIIDNKDAGRFELKVEGHIAVANYDRSDGAVVFTHTEVPEELEGQGIGSRLIKGALDQVRQQGLKVVADCAFVRAYIDKHPEEQDLLG
jgi:predicted GNAT family acetyltransferase